MLQLNYKRSSYLSHQWKFLKSQTKILALVCGFGAGKTHIFLRKTLHHHLFSKTYKGISNGWVLYPTLDLANELFIEDFKELLESVNIKYKHNVQRGRITTKYGIIRIYTLDHPERMVGSNLTYVGIDEFDIVKHKKAMQSFRKALGRLRGSEETQLYIVTTPEGFKATYEIFIENEKPGQEIIHAKTTDNPYLPKSYIETLQEQYDPKLLKAYIEGQFVNLTSGSVYYAFDRDKHVLEDEYKINKNLPVNICFDFNVYPYSVSFNQQLNEKELIFFDEWVSKGYSNTYDACDNILNILPDDIDVVIYGDASGKNGSSSSTMSNYAIIDQKLKDNFKSLNYKVPKANPAVKDRINTFNNKLAKNQILFNKRCVNLIKDLEQVVWNDKNSEIDKSNILRTHSSDGAGYYIWAEFPLIISRNDGQTKMYNRDK